MLFIVLIVLIVVKLVLGFLFDTHYVAFYFLDVVMLIQMGTIGLIGKLKLESMARKLGLQVSQR